MGISFMPHSGQSRVMFIYWGRQGALAQFALDLGRTALVDPNLSAVLSISRQNEIFDAYRVLGSTLLPVNTFRTSIGALTQAWRIPLLRKFVLRRIQNDGIQAVVELMPHVWTPFICQGYRRVGARYVTIVHDAEAHWGDRTALLNKWLYASICNADAVLTLSASVAERLKATGRVAESRIFPLFLPELSYGASFKPRPPKEGEALKLLFLGRLLPYKGLSLFLDAIDLVRGRGAAVEVGVFGEGQLNGNAARLHAIGA